MIYRLGLLDFADVPATLNIHKDCTMKKKLPAYIPYSFSIRELFLHHIEIRAVPKKVSSL